MNERKNRKSPEPILQPPRPAASFDLARLLRDLFRDSGASLHRVEFRAGDVLVRDGVAAGEQTAYLVLKGVLREEKALPHPEKGLTVRTLYEALPGEIAFHQGLFPALADEPAQTRVTATADGEAVCCSLKDFVVNPSAKRLFEDMHRKLQESFSWFNEDVRAFFEKLRSVDENVTTLLEMLCELAEQAKKNQTGVSSPQAILEGYLRRSNENEELRRQAGEARLEATRLKRELETLEQKRKKSSTKIAAQAAAVTAQENIAAPKREIESLKQELEDLRRRHGEVMRIAMEARSRAELEGFRAFALEHIVDRLHQQILLAAGFDQHTLRIEPDEPVLMSGGSVAEMRMAKARLQGKNRDNQWSDDEIDAALASGLKPSAPSTRRISATAISAVQMPASSPQPSIQNIKVDPEDTAKIQKFNRETHPSSTQLKNKK